MRRDENPGRKKCNRLYDLAPVPRGAEDIGQYASVQSIYYIAVDSLIYGYGDLIESYFDEYYDHVASADLSKIEEVNWARNIFTNAVMEIQDFYRLKLCAEEHQEFMEDYGLDQVVLYEREGVLLIRYEEL